MTLDEFERWFYGYYNGWLDLYAFAPNLINLDELIKIEPTQKYSYCTPIREEIFKVQPQEDQDFLILKYSQYL